MEENGWVRARELSGLDGYRAVLRLAEGSASELTLAEPPSCDSLVVIKTLRPGFSDDRHARQRLIAVGKALAAVSHPHLVRFIANTNTQGANPYVVMEYLLGHTLRKELADQGTLPAPQAVELIRQAALGLAAAHAAGVVHGKLDLDDLFLVPESREAYAVKLLGFGPRSGVDDASVDVQALGGILEVLLYGVRARSHHLAPAPQAAPEPVVAIARRASARGYPSAHALAAALQAYVLGLDDMPTLSITTHSLITPTAWSTEPLLQAGQVFERFEVRELIGSGFMGEVYEVSHPHKPALFALKCLKLEHRADPDKVRRSMAEAEVMLRMDHANIVQVFDAGISEQGIVWMLMDRLRGRTLRELGARTRLSARCSLFIAEEIAWALDYAHEFSVIHRDIKPDNVFITSDGRVIVLDLGLGKFIPYGLPGTVRIRPMGSVAYAAPEQLAGALSDCRFDIYSLGVVLHELLAGEHPYASVLSDPLALGHAQITRPLPTLTTKGLPAYLDELVGDLAAKDPSDRFFTAAEAAKALRAARARLEADVAQGAVLDPGYALGTMRPVHRPEALLPMKPARRRWWRPVLTAAGLLAALMIGAACALYAAQ